MGHFTFITVDKNQILEWVNTGSLILFIVVLALVLILFLRGLLRGWKSGTYRILALAIFFIVPLLFLTPIANALGGINLAQWIQGPIQITFGGSTTVSVEVTTVFETTYNFVYAFLHDGVKLSASAASIANYAIALAGSLIRLVLVFIWAIITLTLGSGLITLLWHVAFKHIVPKDKRKPKLRWVSGLEESLAFFAIAIVGISPLTGLVNAIKNNAQIPDTTNETVLMVRDVIDTYDQSIFNKAFFAWTKGSGSDTLDTQIAQFFAQNSYSVDGQTYQANLIKEVRIFSSVEGAIAGALVAPTPNQALATAVLHTSLLIGQTLYYIGEGDNALMNTLVPLTYDVANNADFLREEFGEGESLLSDFSASKKARMNAFDQVASSEFVRTVESVDLATYFEPTYDGLSSFSADSLDRIEANMAKDSEAHAYVNALISGYVYEDYVNNGNTAFEELLPIKANGELDEKRFGAIDWVKEAEVFRHTQEKLHALPKLAHAANNGDDEIIADFIARAARNMGPIIDAIVGKRDADGTPLVNDQGESQQGVCLLDSDLISIAMPGVLQFGALYLNDSILTEPDDPKDFLDKTGAIAEQLVGDPAKPSESKINYKREFGSILDIVGDFTKHEAGQAFIADYKNHPGLEFAADGTLIELDAGIADALVSGIVNLDKSKLLAYAAPVLGDHYVRPMLAVDGTLGKLGITNLDFHCQGLGKEIGNLLSIGHYCNDLIASFGSLFKTDGSGTIDANIFFNAMTELETDAKHYQVTHLLDILTDSPIVNPTYTFESKEVTNFNIASLLKTLLKGLGEESGIDIDHHTLDGMKLAGVWEGDVLKTQGDNFFTVQVFKQIAETGIIEEFASLSESSSTQAIQTLSQIGIDSLFANIGKSQVLRKLLPPIFDTNLLGTLLNSDKNLDLEALGVTYKNLQTADDWAEEGVAMQAILNLAANGLDLSNLDIFDPAIINLVHELAASHIFLMPDDTYVFGTFFTDKILASISDYSQFKLFLDYGDKTVPAFDNKTVKTVLAEKGESYWSGKSAEVIADKKLLCTTFVEAMQLPQGQEGWDVELDKLADVISCIKGLGGIDSLTDFKADSLPAMSQALTKLADMDSLGTILPGNVFNKAFESGTVSEVVKIEDANTGWFFRNAEDYVQAMKDASYDRKDPVVVTCLAAREAEMERIISLISLAVTNDVIKTGKFDFANLDPDALLRPLFYASGSSKVLNPTSTDDLYSKEQPLPEMTVFENLLLTFVKNSGVYSFVDHDGNPLPGYADDAYIKGTKRTVKSIIKSITAADGWNQEADALCHLISTLQDSSFLVDGQISFDVFSTKEGLNKFFNTPGGKEELSDLIAALEESELYYRCLPNKLEDAINNAVSTISFGHIAEDIACADFYLYEDAGKADFPRYSYEGENNTVDTLVDIFAHLASCTEMDLKNFATINVEALTGALSSMAISPIFNKNVEISKTVFKDSVPERKGLTSFQALFCDVLDVDALHDYYFYAGSPKDTYYISEGAYTNSASKAAYMASSLLPALDGTNTAAVSKAADQYIVTELGGALDVLKEDRFAPFLKGEASFDNLDEDSFVILLNALNDCSILRDCVPNAAHYTLINSHAIDIDGIYLESADIYFSYYYYDAEGNFSATRKVTPNFDMPFYGPEIDQIAMIYALLKENRSIMSSMVMKTLDPNLARTILMDLHDSYIFHEARKDDRLDIGDPAAVSYQYFEDLTVFEQFIYKVMIKSNLQDVNYRADKFYQYLFAEDWDYMKTHPGTYSATNGSVGGYYKAHDDIRRITDVEHTWLEEISAFTTDGLHHEGVLAGDPIVGIIAAAQDAGIFEDGDSISINFDAVSKISPDKIRGLLHAINYSGILDDALATQIGSLLGIAPGTNSGIGLNRYTGNTFDVLFSSEAISSTSFDLSKVAAVYDDQDTSKTYHPVTKIVAPVNADPSHNYKAIYHLNATTDLDFTSVVACSYEGGYATFLGPSSGVFELPLEIILDGGHTFTGDATVSVDYAKYDIGREGYEDGAIEAIGYLLSSAYRGQGYANRYFSFKNSDTLTSFFTEYEEGKSAFDHSTYGLLVLFSDSGFYEAGLDATGNFTSDTPNHTASAYALYNALSFEISAPIEVNVVYDSKSYSLPKETKLNLGDLIGKGSTSAEHLAKLENYLLDMTLEHMDYVTKEAYWFDTFAASAGTFAVYDTLVDYVLTNSTIGGLPLTDEIKWFILGQVDNIASQDSGTGAIPTEEIKRAVASTVYDYSVTIPLSDTNTVPYEFTAQRPNIGRSVIANLITSTGKHKGATIALDFAAPTLYFGTSKKSTRVPTTEYTDDLFGPSEDFVNMTPAYLEEVGACFGLMSKLYSSTAFTAEDKTAVKAYFETLDAGKAINFSKLFYVATLYDAMVPMFNWVGATNPNAVYKAVLMPAERCDLPSFQADGYVNGAATALSFATVASLYA